MSRPLEIFEIMALADKVGASDVHLAPGRRPTFRIDGEVERQSDWEALTAEQSASSTRFSATTSARNSTSAGR